MFRGSWTVQGSRRAGTGRRRPNLPLPLERRLRNPGDGCPEDPSPQPSPPGERPLHNPRHSGVFSRNPVPPNLEPATILAGPPEPGRVTQRSQEREKERPHLRGRRALCKGLLGEGKTCPALRFLDPHAGAGDSGLDRKIPHRFPAKAPEPRIRSGAGSASPPGEGKTGAVRRRLTRRRGARPEEEADRMSDLTRGLC